LEDTSVLIFMVAVAVAAVALIWAGFASISAMLNPVRRRLKAMQEDGNDLTVNLTARKGLPSFFWKLLEPGKQSERAGVQLRLLQAGIRFPGAIGALYGAKLVCAALLPVAAYFALPLFPQFHLTGVGKLAVIVLAGFAGSLLPDIYLTRRFEARKEKLMQGLPDALDLLVTCTEAGLGLNAALERVVEQMPASHPELAIELGQVNAEIRAGLDRSTALRNLGERSGLEEINGLVSLISHSTRLGTGIAGTLRIYAEDFRDRRMQRAEEIAATVATKMIFPLVICLFPAFFVVALVPGILNFGKALAK
jgi:tight adherence protein C